MTDKRNKVLLLIAANPGVPWHEHCIQAGYSKKRARVTASELRRDANFQAKLAAIRNKQLAAAPTKEAFYTLLNSAVEAALRESNSKSPYILLRCAELMGQALSAQPAEESPPEKIAVLVNFVESSLPAAEAAAINQSAAEFEAQVGLPQGMMGRLKVPEVKPETPRPVEPKVKKAEPPTKEDRWLHCEQHGKFWNVASCPSCDALQWQDKAYRAAVN